MRNKALLVSVFTLVAFASGHGGGMGEGSVSAGPRAANSASTRLRLEPVDREPAAGRKAPTAKALATLRKQVADKPADRETRFKLVQGLIRAGKLDDALAAAKAWRAKDAYNLIVVRMLGDIYTERGEHARALRAYSAVVELLPKNVQAQRALAGVLKQSGKLGAAYKRLAIARTLRPKDVRITFELADVAHRLRKLSEAETLFEGIATNEAAPSAVRYPAKQRLAQIYSQRRRAAGRAGKTAETKKLENAIAKLQIKGGAVNDIKLYLTWDTDRSDVDLWVENPARERISYKHKKGRFGGALYDDVTTGYGPESFTAHKARKGTYVVRVNYFSAGRKNFAEARGEVVVVLNEGRDTEQRHVLPYRLFRSKQTVTVARIQVR